ncbi:MAG: phosphatidylserine decarboxylase [Halobacteriota archaeon]
MIEEMLSPASGKILRIEREERRTITIFMRLHNVHVISAPLNGVVKNTSAIRGKFKPAFLRSSDFNMRNTIELSTQYGDINVVQIAGFFTRKIICDVKAGQEIRKGERLGKICFGSRVDVNVPDGFGIMVKEGDRVRNKRSVIAVSNNTN